MTVNLAVALAESGYRVGIIDVDFYGPDLPRMVGVFEKPVVRDGRIMPLEAFGVKLMSIGFLIDRDAPTIWRGPIITKILQQFLHDVEWGELDFLLADMPPGTGDAQLSLVQQVHVAGAVIVTTPQEVAVGDALRGAKMFERVNVPVLGVVENMSGFIDPSHRHAARPVRRRRRRASRRRARRAVAGPGAAAGRPGRCCRPGRADRRRRADLGRGGDAPRGCRPGPAADRCDRAYPSPSWNDNRS